MAKHETPQVTCSTAPPARTGCLAPLALRVFFSLRATTRPPARQSRPRRPALPRPPRGGCREGIPAYQDDDDLSARTTDDLRWTSQCRRCACCRGRDTRCCHRWPPKSCVTPMTESAGSLLILERTVKYQNDWRRHPMLGGPSPRHAPPYVGVVRRQAFPRRSRDSSVISPFFGDLAILR